MTGVCCWVVGLQPRVWKIPMRLLEEPFISPLHTLSTSTKCGRAKVNLPVKSTCVTDRKTTSFLLFVSCVPKLVVWVLVLRAVPGSVCSGRTAWKERCGSRSKASPSREIMRDCALSSHHSFRNDLFSVLLICSALVFSPLLFEYFHHSVISTNNNKFSKINQINNN